MNVTISKQPSRTAEKLFRFSLWFFLFSFLYTASPILALGLIAYLGYRSTKKKEA